MSTEMTKLENVKKSCKTAAIVLNVLRIIMIVFAVIAIAGVVVFLGSSEVINSEMAANPEMAEGFRFSYNVGAVDLTDMIDRAMAEGSYAQTFAFMCMGAAVALILVAVIFGVVRKIFVEIMKSESPFSDVILKKLKRIFILLTIIVELSIGLGGAAFLGMIFWCIYTIFQYGCELQKQADETL